MRQGKVRLVLVSELERTVERFSARWDDQARPARSPTDPPTARSKVPISRELRVLPGP